MNHKKTFLIMTILIIFFICSIIIIKKIKKFTTNQRIMK